MNTMVGFQQFGQEVNAFTTVLDTLVQTAQKELKAKQELDLACSHMDTVINLATTLDSQLEEMLSDAELPLSLPVEVDLVIATAKKQADQGFYDLTAELEKTKPSFTQWYSHSRLLKKVRVAHQALEGLYSRLAALKTCDDWDVQMHSDAENGAFDDLLREVEEDYGKGNIYFH